MPIERIPLQKRLQEATSKNSNFLVIFEVFLEDYFAGLSRLSGNSYFMNLYHNEICNESPINDKDYFLASVPQALDALPPNERDKLLLQILVEPFSLLKQEEKKDESIFKDAEYSQRNQ